MAAGHRVAPPEQAAAGAKQAGLQAACRALKAVPRARRAESKALAEPAPQLAAAEHPAALVPMQRAGCLEARVVRQGALAMLAVAKGLKAGAEAHPVPAAKVPAVHQAVRQAQAARGTKAAFPAVALVAAR